ncbi:glycerophosphodiester phosphodiesterase family protein [Agarivorans sp. 1_MG-2023]|uniref:glycerophosphodiester phosphodiesterase family protein n=1 Tax=Agarivorans sp. 1_MG-2023 TaxID=3062634 RepID=UPI0026E1C7C9|nr:glycerophosphodiester phosphodiesterase family protein [Agarivorans sp. 1_MG-2023]MDO6762944.1 glycerophosphodiester phosphodiesterase family protein [Agarivorans sp. 1_MG-2023]
MAVIAGHRGVAGSSPENTLAGLDRAVELGLEWVEFDTFLTKDHQPIVFHDEHLERCTNGSGKATEYTLAQLHSLDAGAWFAPSFAGQALPSLRQYLIHAKKLGLKLNLEMKYHNQPRQQLVEAVVAEIAHCDFPLDRLLISSFDHQLLLFMHRHASQFDLAQLYEEIPENWQQQLQDINALACHCDYKALSVAQAKQIKLAGYRLSTYTVNEPTEITALLPWLDMVISDFPERFNEPMSTS